MNSILIAKARLTPSELVVAVRHLAQGESSASIAGRLHVPQSSVNAAIERASVKILQACRMPIFLR